MRPEDLPREEMEFVKIRSKNKTTRDFDKLFLSQNLMVNGLDPSSPKGSNSDKPCAIWAFRFSRDGEYLAAGGQDGLIRVWGLRLLSEEDVVPFNGKEGGFTDNFPVFSSRPIRTYAGHQSDVLDLSWSKSGFLLSSSTDKTVRLWHVGRSECLCCYQHVDFVTSVAFHPKNDRYFLSGSLDCRIRLWNIPEKKVASWAELPDSNLVTAVGFSPSGRLAIAGSYHGLCLLYKTEGLELHTQITVKSNSKTRNVVPRKITGIETLADPGGGEGKLMITSNDSRIRIYSLKDFSLEQKFKGPENNSNQIKATYSDDQRFIVCGSENRHIYLFDLHQVRPDPLIKRNFIFKKKSEEPGCEVIEAHSHIVTVACLAPTKTKATLARLGDPLLSPNGPQDPDSNLRDNHIVVSADYFGNLKVFRRCLFRSGATPSIRSLPFDDASSLNGDSRSSMHSSIRSVLPLNCTKACSHCGVSGHLTSYFARPVEDMSHKGKSHNGSHSSLIKRIALENQAESQAEMSPGLHSSTPILSPAAETCEMVLVICLSCLKVVSGL
ncbi:hypothetical protein DSO57_1014036 [Entomophthora muscae]|uniref:Uncharacterized protein n=1 Tax=Entomophthora muscae TaxID=34485 RepID=A0ACC2U3B4_9FUNG|nr:hypothetical protein DSO57_1014036 [Entomophthora muscae]